MPQRRPEAGQGMAPKGLAILGILAVLGLGLQLRSLHGGARGSIAAAQSGAATNGPAPVQSSAPSPLPTGAPSPTPMPGWSSTPDPRPPPPSPSLGSTLSQMVGLGPSPELNFGLALPVPVPCNPRIAPAADEHRPLRWLFFQTQDDEHTRGDPFFIILYKGAETSPFVGESIHWGPGFPLWQEGKSLHENLKLRYGDEDYFDIIFACGDRTGVIKDQVAFLKRRILY